MWASLAGLALAVAAAVAVRRWLAPNIAPLARLTRWPGWLRATVLLALVLTLGEATARGAWWVGPLYGMLLGLFPIKAPPPAAPPSASEP